MQMQVGEISFCDQIGHNIKSNETKEKILQELERLTGIKIVQKHYEKFTEDTIERLNRAPYLVSLRTNGNPYLLFLTRINFVPLCIFIDKKIQHGYFHPRMILSKLWFDDELFDNTLLDGEMVKTSDGSWTYIINDLICLKNEYLDKMNMVKRINLLYATMESSYHHDCTQLCGVMVKKYVTVDQIQYLLDEFMPLLNYSCRGIYFKPFFIKFKDILLNFDDSLIKKVVRFKYKHSTGDTFILNSPGTAILPASDTSITNTFANADKSPDVAGTSSNIQCIPEGGKVFEIKKTSNSDIYELIDPSNLSEKPMIALVNNIDTSKFLRDSFRLLGLNDRIRVACSYNQKFKKWAPMKVM